MVIAATTSGELRHGSVSGTLGFPELARTEGGFVFDYRGVAVANMDHANVYGRSSVGPTRTGRSVRALNYRPLWKEQGGCSGTIDPSVRSNFRNAPPPRPGRTVRSPLRPLSPSGSRSATNCAVLNVMSPGMRTGKGACSYYLLREHSSERQQHGNTAAQHAGHAPILAGHGKRGISRVELGKKRRGPL